MKIDTPKALNSNASGHSMADDRTRFQACGQSNAARTTTGTMKRSATANRATTNVCGTTYDTVAAYHSRSR
jgi:hypothetical protein